MRPDEAAWPAGGLADNGAAMKTYFAALPLVLLSASAFAQGQDIVVQGQRALDPPAAREFVARVSRATDGQLARYRDAICPVVVGLPQEQARTVERRIRALAAEVGARADPDSDCPQNLMILAAANLDAFYAEARLKKPEWFTGVPRAEVLRVGAEAGPVRNWSATSLRNDDGADPPAGVLGLGGRSMIVREASILRRPVQQQIDMSFVVFQRSALEGLTLNQIAAYAVMRGLTRTDVPQNPATGTILSLFDPAASPRPEGLSDADMILLKALYSGDGRDSAQTERGRIAARLSKAQP